MLSIRQSDQHAFNWLVFVGQQSVASASSELAEPVRDSNRLSLTIVFEFLISLNANVAKLVI